MHILAECFNTTLPGSSHVVDVQILSSSKPQPVEELLPAMTSKRVHNLRLNQLQIAPASWNVFCLKQGEKDDKLPKYEDISTLAPDVEQQRTAATLFASTHISGR